MVSEKQFTHNKSTDPVMNRAKVGDDEIVRDDEKNEDGTETATTASIILPPAVSALQLRLRQLKQKMNQARQLNQQAVQEEGERRMKGRESLKEHSRKVNKPTLLNKSKAAQLAATSGVDAKHLTEQAADSIWKAERREAKEELNQFSARDYHNPQGMHRNYVRSLKSVPQGGGASSDEMLAMAACYDPLDTAADPEQERQGAQRLAAELRRRGDKAQAKHRKRRLDDVLHNEDVGHISERNRKFNQKIGRNYDEATAEIRQNLERGTAL